MDQLTILEAEPIFTLYQITPAMPPSIPPDIMSTLEPTPKSLTADRLEALLQMQKTDPSHKCISK